MRADELARLIREAIPDAQVRIEDLSGSGDGDHWAAYVVAASFAGKTRVQQHRMVYDALRNWLDRELHALAIQTEVPPGTPR